MLSFIGQFIGQKVVNVCLLASLLGGVHLPLLSNQNLFFHRQSDNNCEKELDS